MVINEVREHLELLLEDLTPVMLLGAPGIGKSSIVKQIAKAKNWELVDLRLSLLNPIDLRGLPHINAGADKAIWLPPEFLPDTNSQKPGILFLDEINVAPISVQQAAYQLLLDKRIGEYKFPKSWRIIAAGNRDQDQASVNSMPAPLTNRLILLHIDATVDDWIIWAKGKVDSRIIEFLKFKPKTLSTLPKKEEKSFASPRSWEVVSDILKRYETRFAQADQDPDFDLFEFLKPPIFGSIGEAVGTEFLSFLRRYADMPDIDGILEGRVFDIPKKTDVIQSTIIALVSRMEDKYFDNVLKYVFSLQQEYAVFTLKELSGNKKWREKLMSNQLYIDWSEKHYELYK